MQKEDIIVILEDKHQDLFTWLEAQPDQTWEQGPDGKWTTGQHVSHLLESIKKVNHALSFPKFLLRYKFGKANREVREYNDVVNRYQTKLSKAQDKARKFNAHLKVPPLKQREQLLSTLQIQNKKLQHKTKRFKDADLDNLILPHPLMGKMPVREIIMWTAYHTEHHTKILKDKH